MPPTTTEPAFLSVRLPATARDRLKTAAAARGETVQSLVGALVKRFLAEEEQRAPDLAVVLGKLRVHKDDLCSRGLAGLSIFGSVARGDARADSDVDLMAEFDADSRLSLVGIASLRAELSDLLGAPADLVERSALRPAVREAAEREAVQAW